MQERTATYTEGRRKFEITVTFGFDLDFAKRNNQAPYYSVTATIDRIGRNGARSECSGGMQHDEVAKHFPDVAATIRWHLADNTATPMHYKANTLYWADHIHPSHYISHGAPAYEVRYASRYGQTKEDYQKHLRSTMVYGALPGEDAPMGEGPEAMGREELAVLLDKRADKLHAVMVADLAAIGVAVPREDQP